MAVGADARDYRGKHGMRYLDVERNMDTETEPR
jgi:hypothetical protein